MRKPSRSNLSLSLRWRQWLAALAVIGLGASAAATSFWPFDAKPATLGKDPSVWQFILADRVTLGLVRVAILGTAAFIIVSVPALVLAGRWLKAFGAQTMAADTADDAKETITEQGAKLREAQEKIKALTEERNAAISLANALIQEQEG